MVREDVLRLLEEMLELPAHAVAGGEALRDLGWDSLSTVMFIALVDKKFGLPLPGNPVARCETVEELVGLIGKQAAGRAAA